MTSTLTARTQLVPVRQPHAPPQQPVIPIPMPRTHASAVSATLKDEFVLPGGTAKFDNRSSTNLKARAAAPGPGLAAGAGSVGVGAGVGGGGSQALGASTAAGTDARTVLGRVNVNVNGPSEHPTHASGAQKRGTVGRAASVKAIPKPSAAPDVFGPEPAVSHRTAMAALGAPLLGKRGRDAVPTPAATLSKRQRAEATAAAAKSHREEQDRWLLKWQKAFPTLVFHFELGAEEGSGRGLRKRVLDMGARVDQFFSARVSHLIVKGAGTPQKVKPNRKGTYSGLASDNPFMDKTGVTDLVDKAKALNIKVWTVKKLADMLHKLAPIGNATGDSLSHLLADERVNGTRERDMNAPRTDYYYFKPGNRYLLIEDATGRNRPIMVKEYVAKERAWPVLHDHFLRVTSSSQLPASVSNSHNLHKDLRARAVALFVDQVPYRGELPPAPEIKPRSKSSDQLPPLTPIPDELPYLKASGNSVVITSAIASTSTANLTPNAFAAGVPQLGTNKDRAIMQLSKRVQVLKGNARLAASVSVKKTSGSDYGVPESTPSGSHNPRRRSTGFDAPASAPAKEFLAQPQVIAMLRQLREPTNMAKPSYDERLQNREQVDAGYKRKDQDTASGYCENCRVRYNDLSVHVASRKHRRFAASSKNFEDLDAMLASLQRPPAPLMCQPIKVCRPCTRRHDKDAACSRCMDDPALYSSPPPSMCGSSPAGTPRSVRWRHGTYEAESDMGQDLEAIEEGDEEGYGEEGDVEAWEEGDRPLAIEA